MDADQIDQRPTTGSLATLAAGCTAGAGLIHFAVVAEHTGGDAIVPIGFALVGWAQVAVALRLVRRSTAPPALAIGVAVNALALIGWVVSRTAGLPFEPYGGVPEAVGTLDLTAAVLQASAIALISGLLVAPARLRIPSTLAATLGIVALGIATVVVVTPQQSEAPVAVAAGTEAAAAGGGGHHGGGAAAAATPAGDHATEMLEIDRARCDMGFNPQAYWDEATAMGVDTYAGGAMAMPASRPIEDVTRPSRLAGRGSETLDRLISLTTVSSGEGAAAQLILELAGASDEEYDAWRRWVAANPGEHSSTPVVPGQAPVATMGHPGPAPWKAIVDRRECDELSAELAQAREVALRYPTVADATAAGWSQVTSYVPGIAAHYMKFDIVDGTFAIDEPEMLLFDGTDPDARIVGLSYYVRLDGTAPPTQGFVADNDQYHRHFGLCIGDGGVIGDSTTTEDQCRAMGGRKSSATNGWMSHAWVVPGCESPWGVFSGENPILDGALGDSSGEPGSDGCAGSAARDRYDLSPGESDLSPDTADEEAAGS